MSYPTFAQLIQRCVLRLGQVTGTAVQTYSEDIIGEQMQHTFDVLFLSTWWDEYMSRVDTAVDYTTGYVTTLSDITTLYNRNDVQYVFMDNDTAPLKRMPNSRNPASLLVQGRPRFLDSDWTNKIRVVPFGESSSANIAHIRFRARPDAFLADDEVKMDAQALILGTAFDYLSDEGSNPTAVEKLLNLYQARLTQLQNARGWLEIHDPRAVTRVADASGWTVVG